MSDKLKGRCEALEKENERLADKLSDCWLLLDDIARCHASEEQRKRVQKFLHDQGAPGWRSVVLP